MTWANVKAWAARAQQVALNLFRTWWRPLACVNAAATLFVNGIYLPLVKGQPADLTGLAAMLGAMAPFAIARTAELIKGRVDDSDA